MATDYLIDTIKKLRKNGKSTRMGVLDNFMRSSKDFNYNGVGTVKYPGNSKTFKSFSKFIEAVEKNGKIKTETVGGFKEFFLIDENPIEESEFGGYSSEKIKIELWVIICNYIISLLKEANLKSNSVFKIKILEELKKSRKRGTLPYNNKVLREVVDNLLDIQFIVKEPNGQIKLNSDSEKDLSDYIRKAYNLQS